MTPVNGEPMDLAALMRAQRLTPAQRRMAQCLLDLGGRAAQLSSSELAELANVSQPSVTRFAMALGFKGYLEMRRSLRDRPEEAIDADGGSLGRYQKAALSEARHLTELSTRLAAGTSVRDMGSAIMSSRPLPVMGLRASAGIATHFAYFAAKFHPDIRLLASGGSLLEDQLEQVRSAGGTWLLAFLMPLYPRESLRALEYAHELGLKLAVVSDRRFELHDIAAELSLTGGADSTLSFDSYATAMFLSSALLDAMCEAQPKATQARLEQNEHSSTRRKVFSG